MRLRAELHRAFAAFRGFRGVRLQRPRLKCIELYMYFRVWDLRVGGAKLSTSSASPRVFAVSPRLRRLSASSASLRVFGVSPRLRRLCASSASLRVFGVSPRLRRLCASSASPAFRASASSASSASPIKIREPLRPSLGLRTGVWVDTADRTRIARPPHPPTHLQSFPN